MTKLNYIVVLLLLFASGNPFFSEERFVTLDHLLIFNFLFFGIIFLLKNKSIDRFYVIFSSIFLLVLAIQYTKFSIITLNTAVGLFLRISIAYLAIKITGENFLRIFVRLMFIFSVISLPLNFAYYLVPVFKDIYISLFQITGERFERISILIISFLKDPIYDFRNMGPFWEPGAFAGYLNLALMINLVYTRKILAKYNVVFIITIITTLSTTGYVALFFVLLSFLIFSSKLSLSKIALTFSLLIVSVILFFSIDFLGQKIFTSFEIAQNVNVLTRVDSRFASTVVDFYDFQNDPMVGRGISNITRFDSHETTVIRTNGFMNFLVKFGLIGFITYFASIFFSMKKFTLVNMYTKNQIYIPLFTLLFIIGFSEDFFYMPFFFSLTFLHLVLNKNEIQE